MIYSNLNQFFWRASELFKLIFEPTLKSLNNPVLSRNY